MTLKLRTNSTSFMTSMVSEWFNLLVIPDLETSGRCVETRIVLNTNQAWLTRSTIVQFGSNDFDLCK